MKKLEITVFALKLRFKALNQKVYSKNQIIESLQGILPEKKDKSPQKVGAKIIFLVGVKITILTILAILPG